MRLSGQPKLVAAAGNVDPATAASLRRKHEEDQLPALLPNFEFAPNR